jgi:YD repeat-containing protein
MNTRFQFFLIIITIGVLCCRQAQAQAVTYGYDASGNRISRVITLSPKATQDSSTEWKIIKK